MILCDFVDYDDKRMVVRVEVKNKNRLNKYQYMLIDECYE